MEVTMRILVSGATATVRKLASRYPDTLGVLHTPHTGNKIGSISLPYACDNAAFSRPDDSKFIKFIYRVLQHSSQKPPMWVAVPDVVGDHSATLQLFGWWCEYWRSEIGSIPFPLAFVLQDGCVADEVPWASIDAVFVGGSTEFKLKKSADLIAEAKQMQKLVHIGRVNTLRRLRFANDVGADTVDGTAFSMYPDTHIPKAMRFLQSLKKSPTLF